MYFIASSLSGWSRMRRTGNGEIDSRGRWGADMMRLVRPNVGGDLASDGRSSARGAMLLAVSNAIVRLHKKYFGKGPTKARAYYDGDVITVVLRDVYTRAELTLLGGGREATV